VFGPELAELQARVTLASRCKYNYCGRRRKQVIPSNNSAGAAKLAAFEDALLANIMVLDAEWLSRAFVQVLEDTPTVNAGGMLDHSRLDVIWRTHNRPEWHTYALDEHPYLIRLMHAFDVSYVLKGYSGTQRLLPQLLPNDRTPTAMENAADLRRRQACPPYLSPRERGAWFDGTLHRTYGTLSCAMRE
jgi:C-terminal of Roc, COR, domain